MQDRSNEEWLADLRGPEKNQAIADLRSILVEGLSYTLSEHHREDMNTLIQDFAQEALLKILDNLDTFRGESKLTTWAQKIAIRVAYSELRRKRWEDISVQDLYPEDSGTDFTPAILTHPDPNPEQNTTQKMMSEKIMRLIQTELTERQKEAIFAVMEGGMPLQVAAEKMGTNRNALYKMIYDARQKLKDALLREGLTPEDILGTFDTE